MTLSKKLTLTLVFDTVGVALTYAYFWILRPEHFFPDRYEDAYQGIIYAVLAAIAAVVLVVVFHFAGRRGDKPG